MTDIPPDCVIPRTRGENAKYVIEQVRALGLEIHSESRLMQMYKVLDSGFIAYDDPHFSTALEAVRDLQQWGFIFDQAQKHPSDEFIALVKKALKDSVLPQKDQQNSVGRDSQFHLYLAAVCQRAGLHPVTYDEPDVLCTIDGREFSIAAKRIKSHEQIKRRIKKAAKQVHGAARPGIIALELSLAWNPRNAPIISPFQSQMHGTVSFLNLFERYETDILRWVNGCGVLAVLVFDFYVRLRLDNHWELDGRSTWLETFQDDKRAEADYRQFYDRFLPGVPGLKHPNADSDARH